MYNVEDVMQQTGLSREEAQQLINDSEQKDKDKGRDPQTVIRNVIKKVKGMSKEEWEDTFDSPYPD